MCIAQLRCTLLWSSARQNVVPFTEVLSSHLCSWSLEQPRMVIDQNDYLLILKYWVWLRETIGAASLLLFEDSIGSSG
jgi:hypothetical protein